MAMIDHDSFASKAWEEFGGQVKEDEARIWLEQEGERKTEKENRCLTKLSTKARNDYRYRCCFATDPNRELYDNPEV